MTTRDSGSVKSAYPGGPETGATFLRAAARRASRVPGYYRSLLARRDRHRWVFGNHKGYRDNSRYLAEHLVAERPDVEAWWIARDGREAAEARAAGLRVAMFGSREAARVQRSAGVAFLCNGFMDLDIVHLGGVYLVHLYHGTPLKRISLDIDFSHQVGRSPLTRSMLAMQRWVLRQKYNRIDMMVAAGELARSRFITSFGLPPERVRALGTPRFDVILGGPAYDRVAGGDLRQRLGIAAAAHVALWLPTWREGGDAAWVPPLDPSLAERTLGGSEAVLLVKPHPLSDHDVFRERLPRHRFVRLLADADVDVNCLLRISDALITDYSSAAFDYAILRRPIHFLAPDIEEYGRGRDLYEPFENVTGGRHHLDWPGLLEALADLWRGQNIGGLETARLVGHLAGNHDAAGSSGRIATAVAEAVGLSQPALAGSALEAEAGTGDETG